MEPSPSAADLYPGHRETVSRSLATGLFACVTRGSRRWLPHAPCGRWSGGRRTLAGVSQPIRVVIAKAGLDGHDRGAKIIARALRDGGVEVIYTGLHQTPEMIVQAAIQEDVQAIGLSILSGAHMTLFKAVLDELRAHDADDIVVFGGGIVPEEDLEPLARMGVAAVFTPGTSTEQVLTWVRENLGDAQGGATRLSGSE